MRTRALLALTALVTAAPAQAASGDRAAARRLPLLTLAELGSLSWTCGRDSSAVTIRFAAETSTATETVQAQSGRSRRTALLQPGDNLSLPVTASVVVRLRITQGTEARTLRADITLTFPGQRIGSSCYRYFPPLVALSLHY